MSEILTENEIYKIIMATIAGNGGTATDQQIMKAVDWAEDARITMKLLDAVLAGQVDILSPTTGDVKFSAHSSA